MVIIVKTYIDLAGARESVREAVFFSVSHGKSLSDWYLVEKEKGSVVYGTTGK